MFSYDSKLPEIVKGDPVRLSQVINNLVSNAIKFTQKGFVAVEVLSTGYHEPYHSVTFSVRDTGIGIPADKLNYIFESFSQATPDTARKFGGTGLGLSITKQLLKLMGSDVIVTSELGRGAEFSFSLEFEAANPKFILTDEQPQQNQVDRNLNILLVDDNEVNLIVATNYLRKWNFQVTALNNATEALERITQRNYNLVLMDLQMPEIDGYEASRRIRQMEDSYFKDVPILAFTASAMIEDIQRLTRAGINDHVTKPFNPVDLHDKILAFALPEVPGVSNSGILLDEYSGNDADAKRLLAERMIDNLKELNKALHESLSSNEEHPYRKSLHKIQTTLSILNNEEFENTSASLKKLLGDKKALADKLAAETERFASLTQTCITEIKKQL